MNTAQLPEHSWRYLVVSGFAALFSNAILITSDWAGLGTGPSIVLSWVLTGTAAYLVHALVTFRKALKLGAWLHFLMGMAVGIPILWALLFLFEDVLGWSRAIAAPVSTALMLGYNYLNARFAIERALFGVSRGA